MQIIGKGLTREEFSQYVNNFDFGSIKPSSLVLHHTFIPTKKDWQGYKSVLGLKSYYEGKGWPAGPHCFVGEDKIWLFTPMSEVGIHAGEGNATWKNALGKLVYQFAKPFGGNLVSYSIGIEVVGDYDFEKWGGETLKNAVFAINKLRGLLGVSTERIFFHRDFSTKSCPGWSITKEWLGQQLAGSSCTKACPEHCK